MTDTPEPDYDPVRADLRTLSDKQMAAILVTLTVGFTVLALFLQNTPTGAGAGYALAGAIFSFFGLLRYLRVV